MPDRDDMEQDPKQRSRTSVRIAIGLAVVALLIYLTFILKTVLQ